MIDYIDLIPEKYRDCIKRHHYNGDKNIHAQFWPTPLSGRDIKLMKVINCAYFIWDITL